jgi:SanA protein
MINRLLQWPKALRASRRARLIYRGITWLLLMFTIGLYGLDAWISWQTQELIVSENSSIKHYQVAVVLGTSKYLGKTLNEYYVHRIDAAIRLYKAGKVDNFLLSGDNAHRSYNEPWTMKRDLLRAGVPESAIFLDYAGFRTLDSIIRAKKIFATDHFLIITQRFHCERALYIAEYHDISANCLAVSGPLNSYGFKVRLREVFARTKAFLDLYVLNAQPKFLGPQVPILGKSDAANDESDTQEDTATAAGEIQDLDELESIDAIDEEILSAQPNDTRAELVTGAYSEPPEQVESVELHENLPSTNNTSQRDDR